MWPKWFRNGFLNDLRRLEIHFQNKRNVSKTFVKGGNQNFKSWQSVRRIALKFEFRKLAPFCLCEGQLTQSWGEELKTMFLWFCIPSSQILLPGLLISYERSWDILCVIKCCVAEPKNVLMVCVASILWYKISSVNPLYQGTLEIFWKSWFRKTIEAIY